MNLRITTIIIKSAGALLIIIATLISTIKIAQIDQQILLARDKIDSHLSQTKHNMHMILFYEMKYIKYQMDIFQHNVLSSFNTPQSTTNYLDKIIENDMGKIVESWETLWTEDDYKQIKENTKEKINKIKNNESLTHTQKLDELERIWLNAVNRFDDKMNQAEDSFEENKKIKLEQEIKRIFWQNTFVWFQILGLILIAFSEVLDRTIKSK